MIVSVCKVCSSHVSLHEPCGYACTHNMYACHQPFGYACTHNMYACAHQLTKNGYSCRVAAGHNQSICRAQGTRIRETHTHTQTSLLASQACSENHRGARGYTRDNLTTRTQACMKHTYQRIHNTQTHAYMLAHIHRTHHAKRVCTSRPGAASF
jgi:hypothetical protein